MTRKFKLAVIIFIDEDELKIIRNSKNENVILLILSCITSIFLL